jgi:hypothetical protein
VPQQRGSLVGRFHGVPRRMRGHRRSALLATRGKLGDKEKRDELAPSTMAKGLMGCRAHELRPQLLVLLAGVMNPWGSPVAHAMSEGRVQSCLSSAHSRLCRS